MHKEQTQLLEALDLESFSFLEREQILLTLSELVTKSSLVRMIEQMDDATKEEFIKICEENTPGEKMDAFITAKVPNADEIVREVIAEIANDIAVLDIPQAA